MREVLACLDTISSSHLSRAGVAVRLATCEEGGKEEGRGRTRDRERGGGGGGSERGEEEGEGGGGRGVHRHDHSRSYTCLLMCSRGREYHWPLPEAFWLDRTVADLPPRSAIPLLYAHSNPEAQNGRRSNAEEVFKKVVRSLSFPIDQYEVVVRAGRERRMGGEGGGNKTPPMALPPPRVHWPIYVAGSAGENRACTWRERGGGRGGEGGGRKEREGEDEREREREGQG